MKLREEIDRCDKILVKAFEKRMETVLKVLEYKRKNGLPIFQPDREQRVMEKVLSYLNSDMFSEETKVLYREILRISRKCQSRRLFPYNIVLIGFMGTGKTTVGKALATLLEMEHVDLDSMVEERLGMSIPKIFEAYGEDFFRKHEREAVKDLCKKGNLIISCGGGVILDPQNVQDLKRNGKIVLLHASAEKIYERVCKDEHRPLLKGKMSMEHIECLLAEREVFYHGAADIETSTDGKTIEEVCREIIFKLLQEGN